MRLEFDKPVYDLSAGALEGARPADIGLFVEAGLELDQCGNRLSGFCRLDQRADDGRLGRRAIERLLDGDDVGIARRLLQKLHDDVERLVRVMDNQVFLANGREAVAGMVANTLGDSGGCTGRIRGPDDPGS